MVVSKAMQKTCHSESAGEESRHQLCNWTLRDEILHFVQDDTIIEST